MTTAELALDLLLKAKPNARAHVLREKLIRRQMDEKLRAELEQMKKSPWGKVEAN